MAIGLRDTLAAGGTLSASWLFLGSPVTSEIMSCAGFDVLILDREHSPGGMDTLYHQLRAISVPAIVRVGEANGAEIKRVLDAGAAGVALPALGSAEEARRFVAATRYAPAGTRGVQRLSRASVYGTRWREYAAGVGAAPLTLGLIETRAGLAALDDILDVGGLDVIFIGTGDLAADLGHVDAPSHPCVREAVAEIEVKTLAAGGILGGLAHSLEDAADKRKRGYRLLSFGSDALILRDGALAAAAMARGSSG